MTDFANKLYYTEDERKELVTLFDLHLGLRGEGATPAITTWD